MQLRASLMLILTFLLLPVDAMGADVTGSLLYDGRPLADVFDDIDLAKVYATPTGGGDQIEGTLDLAGSSYHIDGLIAGRYWIAAYLDRTAPTSEWANPGDLVGNATVEPEDSGDSLQLDIDFRIVYRVLSPVDSTTPLDGSGLDCNTYPSVPYPITVALEPVPLATQYTFNAILKNCPEEYLDEIDVKSETPSAQFDWGSAGEDFQEISVLCSGAGGKNLCQAPQLQYDDIFSLRLFLRNQASSGRGIHHSDAVVIPAVASSPGAGGTFWSSAVSVVNLIDTDRHVEVIYTPRKTDGLTSYIDSTVSLPALSAVSWSDIVADLFSTAGAGALEIQGGSLAVTSRTSTPGIDDGSYGQGIPPIQPEQILSTAGTSTATMVGIEEGAAFRTNLGLCEVWGESAVVTISVMDASMVELGNRSYELRPYENIQIDRVADKIGGVQALSNGLVTVVVTSGNGRIGAYLSVVDNATGDPTYIAIAPQSPIGG